METARIFLIFIGHFYYKGQMWTNNGYNFIHNGGIETSINKIHEIVRYNAVTAFSSG